MLSQLFARQYSCGGWPNWMGLKMGVLGWGLSNGTIFAVKLGRPGLPGPVVPTEIHEVLAWWEVGRRAAVANRDEGLALWAQSILFWPMICESSCLVLWVAAFFLVRNQFVVALRNSLGFL